MKTFVRILIFASLTTLATHAFAQPAPEPRHGDFQPQEMLKHWGLTDDQSKQVLDLWTQQQTVAAPQRAQIRVLNAQIDEALTTSHPDLGAINALVDKKTQAQAELQKQRLAVIVQIHQIVGDKLFYQLEAHWLRSHASHRPGSMQPQNN